MCGFPRERTRLRRVGRTRPARAGKERRGALGRGRPQSRRPRRARSVAANQAGRGPRGPGGGRRLRRNHSRGEAGMSTAARMVRVGSLTRPARRRRRPHAIPSRVPYEGIRAEARRTISAAQAFRSRRTVRKVSEIRRVRFTRLRLPCSIRGSFSRFGISCVHLYRASPVRTATLRRSRGFSTFSLLPQRRNTMPQVSRRLMVATCSAKLRG